MIVDDYADISKFCMYRNDINPGCNDCSFALKRDGKTICTAILFIDLTDDRSYLREFGEWRGYNG